MRESYRRALRWGLAALFVAAGALHFLRPGFYLRIMPPYLPYHQAHGASLYTAALLLRLPLQFVLMAWVWECAVRGKEEAKKVRG